MMHSHRSDSPPPTVTRRRVATISNGITILAGRFVTDRFATERIDGEAIVALGTRIPTLIRMP
jgi:hypothetical protein